MVRREITRAAGEIRQRLVKSLEARRRTHRGVEWRARLGVWNCVILVGKNREQHFPEVIVPARMVHR